MKYLYDFFMILFKIILLLRLCNIISLVGTNTIHNTTIKIIERNLIMIIKKWNARIIFWGFCLKNLNSRWSKYIHIRYIQIYISDDKQNMLTWKFRPYYYIIVYTYFIQILYTTPRGEHCRHGHAHDVYYILLLYSAFKCIELNKRAEDRPNYV